MTIAQRLETLREVMRREHLSAFIFPSTDPHQGEYIPDHWKGREFISGFNGSAGTAVDLSSPLDRLPLFHRCRRPVEGHGVPVDETED